MKRSKLPCWPSLAIDRMVATAMPNIRAGGLVVGADEDRGFARKRRPRIIILRIDEGTRMPSAMTMKPASAVMKESAEPENVDGEKHHQRDFEPREASDAENEIEFADQIGGDAKRAAENERSPPGRFRVGLGLAPRGAVEPFEALRRENRLRP